MRNQNKWKVFYSLTLLIGIFLMVLEIHIYRVTIVRATIPISIILAVGLTTFFLNKDHLKKTGDVEGPFLPLIQSTASWGFMACYLFMATNYYLADDQLKEVRFEIKSKRSMPGPKGRREERKPLVTIDYFGFEKELIFEFSDTERVENADEVTLTVRKGLLGFDIFERYDVVDAR